MNINSLEKQSINNALKKLLHVREYPCITITLPTHRTFPDCEQDAILLKNLIKEVQERLLQEFDKRAAEPFFQKMDALASQIDHRRNLEGLVLFISPSVSEFVRLPIELTPQTAVDETFLTRHILRTLHKVDYYYTLLLSMDRIRLLGGIGNALYEIEDFGFPMQVDPEKLGRIKSANPYESDSSLKEFYNQADKAFQRLYHEYKSGHLILFGDSKNVAYYRSIAARPQWIIGSVSGNYLDKKPHEIAPEALALLNDYLQKQRIEMIGQLERAFKERAAISGLQEVYQAAVHARGRMLLVETNYQQAAKILDNDKLLTDVDPKAAGVTDDVVDDIIEMVIQFGGQVIFLPDESIAHYGRIAMITRF